MEKEHKVEKAKSAPRQRFKAAPPSSDAWDEFQRNLATALADLEEDECLIIASKAEHYFVQFAGQGKHGMRAEAVSNERTVPDTF